MLEFIREHLERDDKEFNYKIWQLVQLCDLAVQSFASQETLIRTFGPIYVCGDIHGQYTVGVKFCSLLLKAFIKDLFHIFHACGPPHKSRYLFLGDYVDRGAHSLEVICLLLACKIQWPRHFFLLRGNHELHHINGYSISFGLAVLNNSVNFRLYGFNEELARRLPNDATRIWTKFNDVFAYMPLAATIGDRILCMHGEHFSCLCCCVIKSSIILGGISPHLKSLEQIRAIQRPIMNGIWD